MISHGRATSALAEYRHLVRIASEFGDVALHPLQREILVLQTLITLRSGKFQGQKSLKKRATNDLARLESGVGTRTLCIRVARDFTEWENVFSTFTKLCGGLQS